LLFVGGCVERDTTGATADVAVFDHAGLAADSLSGTALADSATVGVPVAAHVSGSGLWLLNALGDPAVHLVDPASGGVRMSVGGPSARVEVVGPVAFSNDPQDSGAVWVFDAVLQRMTRLEPDMRAEAIPRNVTLWGSGVAIAASWLSADRIVAVTPAGTGGIALFDAQGILASRSDRPALGDSTVSAQLREQAMAAPVDVCARPDGTRFAVVHVVTSRVDLFDGNGRIVSHANVPIAPRPIAPTDPDTNEPTLDRRRWYTACAASQTHLYALFSGRRPDGFDADAVELGEFVHVFDWTGELVRVLHLEPAVIGLAVDEPGGALYGVSHVARRLYRYELGGNGR
jgi:hypothetical protein